MKSLKDVEIWYQGRWYKVRLTEKQLNSIVKVMMPLPKEFMLKREWDKKVAELRKDINDNFDIVEKDIGENVKKMRPTEFGFGMKAGLMLVKGFIDNRFGCEKPMRNGRGKNEK